MACVRNHVFVWMRRLSNSIVELYNKSQKNYYLRGITCIIHYWFQTHHDQAITIRFWSDANSGSHLAATFTTEARIIEPIGCKYQTWLFLPFAGRIQASLDHVLFVSLDHSSPAPTVSLDHSSPAPTVSLDHSSMRSRAPFVSLDPACPHMVQAQFVSPSRALLSRDHSSAFVVDNTKRGYCSGDWPYNSSFHCFPTPTPSKMC